MSCSVMRMDTTGIITADDIEWLRLYPDGIIVAYEGQPLVRGRHRYDHNGEGQIIVLEGDPAKFSLYDTDKEIAEDLSARWTNLVSDARERYERERF